MQITIARPLKDKVDTFFEYLKEVAQTPEHEANRDLIADFVEKVMVVEMKKLANVPTEYEEEINIPESVLAEPLRNIKSKIDEVFRKLDINDLGKIDIGEVIPAGGFYSEVPPERKMPEKIETFDDIAQPAVSGKKSGNGHVSKKKRNLTDGEKDNIRHDLFMAKDGRISDDDCVEYRKGMDQEVAIFQVTGFISYLHVKVAEGSIMLADTVAYLDHLKNKYPALLAQYNSLKYQMLRQKA